MTILNCLIYATGVMVLIAIFSLLLTSAIFTAFDIIVRRLKKPQKFEDTALGLKVLYEMQQIIDSCNTAEDAKVKVQNFCEIQSCCEYSNLKKAVISYFEQKFGVKYADKNDVLNKTI